MTCIMNNDVLGHNIYVWRNLPLPLYSRGRGSCAPTLAWIVWALVQTSLTVVCSSSLWSCYQIWMPPLSMWTKRYVSEYPVLYSEPSTVGPGHHHLKVSYTRGGHSNEDFILMAVTSLFLNTGKSSVLESKLCHIFWKTVYVACSYCVDKCPFDQNNLTWPFVACHAWSIPPWVAMPSYVLIL